MRPTLRDDQRAAVRALSAAFAEGAKRVLLQAPTGWGKGTVAAFCLASRAARSLPTVFIAHLEEINADLVSRLLQAGAPSVRVLMGEHAEGPAGALVTVASVQTLDRRSLQLGDPSLLWFDEAHRVAADSYQRVAARHPSAQVVGSTATPARADGRSLAFFDRIVPGPQVAALVEAGRLAPIRVESPDTASDDLAQDPAAVYPVGRPGLVFCKTLQHSRSVATVLRARGVRAEHVEGRTQDRPALVRAFNAGEVDVLCNKRLLVEGVDVPRAEVCMLASPFTSVVAFLQAVGRVRRPRPGKRALLLDLCGSMWVHKHPDIDRTFALDGRGIRPSDSLPSCVQCRGCLGWRPAAPYCPECGFALPPPPPPRLTLRELKERRLESQPRRGEDWELWVSLVALARERGWKPQAAFFRFRERTGRVPRWGIKQALEALGVPSGEARDAS